MTRMSKQGKKRAVSPRRSKAPSPKSGPKKDSLSEGFKTHQNALGENSLTTFIGKIK